MDETEKKQNAKVEKKVTLTTVAMVVLILTFFYFVLVGCLLYFFPLAGKIAENSVVKKTIRYVPYPAAMVGGNFITANELSANLKSVRTFYENQDFSDLGMRVDFSTPDGEKRLQIKEKQILNKLISDRIIEAEAKKRKINLTAEVVDQEVDRKLKEYGAGEYLRENLQKLYGWNLEDFKKNIVKPDLYAKKLALDIREKDPAFPAAKEKIEAAKKELDDRVSFSEVAKKYSEGSSAEKGGELGWFGYAEMVPEVAMEVFNLEKGQESPVIESSLGYHIVKVEDKKSENDEDKVKVSQIFVRTQPFFDWIFEAGKKYKIFIPLQKFHWNKELGEVEFQSEDMRNYEDNLLKNPINDPSVIF